MAEKIEYRVTERVTIPCPEVLLGPGTVLQSPCKVRALFSFKIVYIPVFCDFMCT